MHLLQPMFKTSAPSFNSDFVQRSCNPIDTQFPSMDWYLPVAKDAFTPPPLSNHHSLLDIFKSVHSVLLCGHVHHSWRARSRKTSMIQRSAPGGLAELHGLLSLPSSLTASARLTAPCGMDSPAQETYLEVSYKRASILPKSFFRVRSVLHTTSHFASKDVFSCVLTTPHRKRKHSMFRCRLLPTYSVKHRSCDS